MNVIRHNNIFLGVKIVLFLIHFAYVPINNFPNAGQMYLRGVEDAAPYNF